MLPKWEWIVFDFAQLNCHVCPLRCCHLWTCRNASQFSSGWKSCMLRGNSRDSPSAGPSLRRDQDTYTLTFPDWLKEDLISVLVKTWQLQMFISRQCLFSFFINNLLTSVFSRWQSVAEEPPEGWNGSGVHKLCHRGMSTPMHAESNVKWI